MARPPTGKAAFDTPGEPTAQRIAAGIAKLGAALRSHAWRAADARGLTPTQGQVLGFLQSRAPAPVRLSAVAEALQTSAPTASDAVAALVRKGLVERGRDEDDARAVALRLTPVGLSESRRAAEWPDFLLRAVDTLPPDEQEALLRALVGMIRELQERGEIPVARLCVTCRYFRPYAHPKAEAPHHCAFVDAPFGDRHLRLDCQDHDAAQGGAARATWTRFAARGLDSALP